MNTKTQVAILLAAMNDIAAVMNCNSDKFWARGLEAHRVAHTPYGSGKGDGVFVVENVELVVDQKLGDTLYDVALYVEGRDELFGQHEKVYLVVRE